MSELRFIVEEAGCESCAQRVRAALERLLTVDAIVIDESADTAVVEARADSPPSLDAIDSALAEVSAGSGHTYRVRR